MHFFGNWKFLGEWNNLAKPTQCAYYLEQYGVYDEAGDDNVHLLDGLPITSSHVLGVKMITKIPDQRASFPYKGIVCFRPYDMQPKLSTSFISKYRFFFTCVFFTTNQRLLLFNLITWKRNELSVHFFVLEVRYSS